MAGQLEQLEESTRNGYAPKEKIEGWIKEGWISQVEAGRIFSGYEEVIAQARRLHATDYAKVLDAYERYWIDKTDRDVIEKNLGSDMSHARHIVHWLEEACPNLGELNPEMARQYLLHLKEQEYSDNTIKNRLNIFRQILDQAVILDMIGDNPARKLNLKQVNVRLRGATQARRLLADEEIPLLLEASLRHRHLLSGGLPTVVRLGLYAGLRNQEMCWLKWEAIEWDRRIITVQETLCEATGERWKPKDHEVRRLDVKPACIDYLAGEQKRLEREGLLGPFIMPGGNEKQPNYRSRPLHQDAPQKAFAKMIAAENMAREITIYSLRHTYATMALRSGIDLRTLQRRMGHSDIKTTMEYLHFIEPEEHPMDRLPY